MWYDMTWMGRDAGILKGKERKGWRKEEDVNYVLTSRNCSFSRAYPHIRRCPSGPYVLPHPPLQSQN